MRVFIITALALLTSCSITVDRPDQARQSHQRPDWVSEREIARCPVYTPPPVRTIPQTPAEEYRKIPKKDTDAREQLLLDHIEELRNYIRLQKSETVDAYSNYLRQCAGK